MDDLFADFLAETRVELDRAQDALSRLEQGASPSETLGDIERGLQAIRTACAAIGFVRISALATGALAFLDRLRIADVTTPADARTLRRAVDRITRLVATLAATGADPLADPEPDSDLPPLPANDSGFKDARYDEALPILSAPAPNTPWAEVEAALTSAIMQMRKPAGLIIEPSARALSDALIHAASAPLQRVVRFLYIYSIEPELIRRAHGKLGEGAIRIASLSVGTEAVIAISDDGAGLDPKRLRARAQNLGLETEHLSDAQAIDLIFAPKLSTLGEGYREPGLDSVKAKLEALGGGIEVTSIFGRGATFIVRLPTHAIQGAA